jgi:hypothetical protein
MPPALIRWQARRALQELEQATASKRLEQATTPDQRVTARAQLDEIARRLRALGPNPAPKMG